MQTGEAERRAWIVAIGVFAAVCAVKLALAASWQLLADEAYYWVWAQHLDLGYYDQPPAIAWLIAATTSVGDGELLVRVGAVGCGVVGALALAAVAGDRRRGLLWWVALPPLAWLTLFATSDAPLLAAWAVGLAAAVRGGRWWLVAGAAAGVAFLSKYTGLALLPLAILATPEDWKSPWPWAGMAVLAVLAAPNLVWNASHDWVAFAFQASEGLGAAEAPGLGGVVTQVRDQVLVITPILAIAGLVWTGSVVARLRSATRVERIALATSAPLFVLFAGAATLGVPEAHWTAPAIIGLGLGVCSVGGRAGRIVWLGMGLGGLASAVLVVHGVLDVLPLSPDPADRLRQGVPLAAAVTALVAEPGAPGAVYAERYQEAAFIRYYAGIKAERPQGCGRSDQYDLWPRTEADDAWFVRPRTSGPTLCTDDRYPSRAGPRALAEGWQAFRIRR